MKDGGAIAVLHAYLPRISAGIYDMIAMSSRTALVTIYLLLATFIPSSGQAPQNAQAQAAQYTRLAEQYLREQRPDLAIPELQKVLTLDPSNVDARGNLGVLLFFRSDYKDAVPQLREAVHLQPGLWKLQALLGLGEKALGDSAASQTDLQAAFPHLNGEKIQMQVGESLIDDYTAKEELGKAANIVSAMLATDPTNANLLYMSYRLYTDLAGKAMLTLALVAPNSAQMHQVMARELARQNQNEEAIANYRAAIKIDPNLPGLHTELGDLLLNSDSTAEQAEAESEFKAALALNPKDEQAELELGMAETKQGHMNAAFADYSRAVEINPDDGLACTELGKLLADRGQSQEAQKMFERAVRLDPTNDIAYYRLAAIYRREGNTQEAKEQIQLYLKYKKMRDAMEKIFDDMRDMPPQSARNNDKGK